MWLGVVGRLVCHVGWVVGWSAIILERARSYTSMLLSEHEQNIDYCSEGGIYKKKVLRKKYASNHAID